MTHDSFDAVIVGSGAGGCAAAWQLARAGFRVAVVEKGDTLPTDGSTLDFRRVIGDGHFKSHESWLDRHGERCCPEEYFNVGGKTKWYGAALLRYGRQEFAAEPAHQCLPWPISYDDLAPYYDVAERRLGIRRFAAESDLQRIAARIAPLESAWRYAALPMGLSADIVDHPEEARHFDGFASVAGLKSDAQSAFLRPALQFPNLSLMTRRTVTGLLGDAQDPTRIVGVHLENGAELRARCVILAAGALHSPRLLQGHIARHGLSGRLVCADQVGRNLKMHVLTAMVAASSRPVTDLMRKTLAFTHAELPHSTVQPLGFDGELLGSLMPRMMPRAIAKLIGDRAYGFFLQTEDGAHPDNRVIGATAGASAPPVLDYDVARVPAALAEHESLVRRFRAALARAGLIGFARRVGVTGTAHVSGTLTAGVDPARSVVDGEGCVHGMQSLYVVDGSILPRSSRVNPSLTIFAWGLRTAQRLGRRLRHANA